MMVMGGCRGCLALGALASAALHGVILVSWLSAPEPPSQPPSEQALTLDLALFAPGPQAGPTEPTQTESASVTAPLSPPSPETEPAPAPEKTPTPVVAEIEANDLVSADTLEPPDLVPKAPDAPEPLPETPSPAPPEPLAALAPAPDPTPAQDFEVKPEPPAVYQVQSRPKPEPKPRPKAEPKPKPAAKAKPKPAPKVEPKPTPRSQAKRDIAVSPASKDRPPAQTGKGEAKGRTAARTTGATAAEKARAEQAYLAELQRAIGRHQRFPDDARKRRKTGTATLSFVIKSDGRIRSVRLAKSSGDASLDKAALQALHRLNRFKPIPVAIGRSSWTLRVPIRFDLR